jgi:hypothetical protein
MSYPKDLEKERKTHAHKAYVLEEKCKAEKAIALVESIIKADAPSP